MAKKVAAIVTVYRRWSHADVIVGKILEGFLYDGKSKPDLELVSLYVDQHPKNDDSHRLAEKYGFRLCKTIDEALTLGGNRLAVDGVLSIGEHGEYPKNNRGQILYPRRKFFEAIISTFDRCKQVVPVFNDKHLSATWADAKWMYDAAKERFIPLLAGSSIPLTWRKPAVKFEKQSELIGAVQLGYGPFEGYGFHALEGLQCMVERRKGGETGVKAVTCVQGPKMWETLDKGEWSQALLDAAMQRVPAHAQADYRKACLNDKEAGIFLIEYRDGFRAAVAMLNGWLHEGDGGAFCFAGQVKDQYVQATQFYLQQPDPFAHFSYLLKAIEAMIQTGHAPYPVERTLLTTGILDAVMVSQAEGNRRVETPHLNIAYQPTDWGFATDPVPMKIERK